MRFRIRTRQWKLERFLGILRYNFQSTLPPPIRVYLAVTQHTLLSPRSSQFEAAGRHVPASCFRCQSSRDSPIPVHTRGSRYIHTNALCVRSLRRRARARVAIRIHARAVARAHAWIHLHQTDAGRRGTLRSKSYLSCKNYLPISLKESLVFAVKQSVLRNAFPFQDDACTCDIIQTYESITRSRTDPKSLN